LNFLEYTPIPQNPSKTFNNDGEIYSEMNRNWQISLCKLFFNVPILTIWAIACWTNGAVAQITPDGSLGNERSKVTPQNQNSDRIDGGAIRGTNLFHSFQDFNIGEGRGAYFANPAGVENILSRVTGGNPSNIFGTLGVLGNANLYLLNPNGIIFGPNAKLDIRGSFVASAAGGVNFSDRTFFGADRSQTTPLLTMAVPVGLQYGTQQAGNISNAGNLAVGQGQKLALVGGTVTSSGQLTAPGGTVHLLGNRVGLLDNARVDVSGETVGGTVLIGGDFQGKGEVPNAARTFVSPGTTINADALTNGDGGRVIVWADEVTGFYGNINARGGANSGNGGFVEVSGKQNLIFDGTINLSAVNGSFGNLLLDPTNITIVNGVDGTDNAQVAGDAQIFAGENPPDTTISEATLESLSATANIILEATKNITINDLADNKLSLASAFFLPPGTGGSVTFKADADNNGVGDFVMNSGDEIFAQSRNLIISGASVTVGRLATSSDPSNSGSINVTATNGNITTGGYINATSKNGSAGSIIFNSPGGGINTTAGVLDTRSTFGEAGEITLSANGNITTSGLWSNVEETAVFNGRNITLTSTVGEINTIAGVLQSYSGGGNGGSVTLNANRNITTGSILSNSGSTGKAGNIFLTSRNGTINTSAGIINASSGTKIPILLQILELGTGNAGDVTLTAKENILSGSIESVGLQGGNITLNSSNGKISLNQADIASITVGGEKGNDIRLSANQVELTDARVATVKVGEGEGGNLFVNSSDDLTIKNSGNSSPNGIGSNFFEAFKGSLQGTGLASTTLTFFEGDRADSGNIEIRTNSLTIENLQKSTSRNSLTGIGTLPLGNGNAGDITVEAADFVSIIGNDSTPYNTALPDDGNASEIANKKAGDIQDIRTGITSATTGIGNAGEIKINTGRFEVKNTAAITSGVTNDGEGRGNNITVNANSIELRGKAVLATASRSKTTENGNLNVNADKITLLNGALLSTDAFEAANGGNLNINTNELNIFSGSRIASTSFGSGNGGTVTINNPQTKTQIVNIDGTLSNGQLPVKNQDGRSGIFTESRANGSAGNINIYTDTLDVKNRGEISVSSFNIGQAGDLNITADSIFLNRQARLNSSARFGIGGNIEFNVTGNIRMGNDGDKDNATEISSTAFNDANGGNIIFNVSPKSFILANRYENSDVVATAEGIGKKGGLVDATSANGRRFNFRPSNGQRTEESDFTAVSALGLDGIVLGTQTDLQPQLPQQPVVRDIPQVCPANQGVTTRQAGRSAYSK
jgi:filamentous hemagglutinin family protein